MKTTSLPLDGDVHIYCLALPHDSAELEQLGAVLTLCETERAALLRSDQGLKCYITGRGVLREIMGGYLGVEAGSVPLESGVHGKPFLAADDGNLSFNLSHSGDLLALAVTAGREVGIDIESIVPGKPLLDMARMVFTRDEQERLSYLASPDLEELFYRYWVRKEACLKACGRGFSLPSNNFEVSPLHEESAVMLANCDQKQWQVLDIAVPHGYCAALAVEACPSNLLPPNVLRVAHRLSCN